MQLDFIITFSLSVFSGLAVIHLLYIRVNIKKGAWLEPSNYDHHLPKPARLLFNVSDKHVYKIMLYILTPATIIVCVIVKKIIENKDIDDETIIGKLIKIKMIKESYAYFFLINAMYIYVGFLIAVGTEFNYWVIGVMIAMLMALALSHELLKYRLVKGYFGNNEYETREVISYIQKYLDPDDFNGGEKTFIQKPQNEKVRTPITGGEVV